MKSFDVVIIPTSRVGINEKGRMIPTKEAKMECRAAGLLFRKGLTEKILISGGYNCGVCYPPDISTPVFGDQNSTRDPDFSQQAKREAKLFRSEASVKKVFIENKYRIPPEVFILEEDSHTLKENARNCKRILKRMDSKRVGLITMLPQMIQAINEFQNINVRIQPIFPEDVLVRFSNNGWPTVIYLLYENSSCWDADKIFQLLANGKSIGKLINMTG